VRFRSLFLLVLFFTLATPPAGAWYDETHLAIGKAAGHKKWFLGAGADMAKVKCGAREGHNHYVNNPPGSTLDTRMVFAQVERYDQIDDHGHLYGSIIASLRDYIRTRRAGGYGEYHLGYCAHYIGDLSQPLHNTVYNRFNRKHHQAVDGIINDEVMDHVDEIPVYPVVVQAEEDLAAAIARIANLSLRLGYRIQKEDRLLTREEAYTQIGHSASLLKGVLEYMEELDF